MKEIELLYRSLTHVSYHGLSIENDFVTIDQCSHCGELDKMGLVTKNSYKEELEICENCYSFYVSNVQMLGVEKASAPNTSQKFGMLVGSGCLIEKETGKVVFFAPPASYAKFPQCFKEMFMVIEASEPKQAAWIVENLEQVQFPVLWVQNFGRKTQNLIKNLKYSDNISSMYPINDDELNSSLIAAQKVDLNNLMLLKSFLEEQPKKLSNAFIKLIKDLANGKATPQQSTTFFENNNVMLKALALLPVDPHLRLNTFTLLNKLK